MYSEYIASASVIFGALAQAGLAAATGALTNQYIVGLVVFTVALGIGLKWFFGSVRRV